MNTISIPVSQGLVERFRQLPTQKQKLLKAKVATLLEQELAPSGATDMNLTDFQEAMNMSNNDMVLTFGEVYLNQRSWVSTHE